MVWWLAAACAPAGLVGTNDATAGCGSVECTRGGDGSLAVPIVFAAAVVVVPLVVRLGRGVVWRTTPGAL